MTIVVLVDSKVRVQVGLEFFGGLMERRKMYEKLIFLGVSENV